METPAEKSAEPGKDPAPVEKKDETAQEEIDASDQTEPRISQTDGIKIVLQSRLIVLSPLRFEDFPLTRVLINSNFRAPTEYQSLIMAKLINAIIARSRLTPEEMEILRSNLLRTYHVISSAIEKALVELISEE